MLSGANLAALGLTSAGGWLPEKEEIKEGEVVAVEAKGNEERYLVGVLKMETEEMKEEGII